MQICKLPIGSKIREPKSNLIFLVADHHHMGYTGTTLIADSAILNGCLDAAEPDNPDEGMADGGNNFYPQSNIHQWLNSDQEDWYRPAHDYDAPPISGNVDMGRQDIYDVPDLSEHARLKGDFSYMEESGFLSWLSPKFVDALIVSKVPCTDIPRPGVVRHGPPIPYYLEAKVFLPSALELGFDRHDAGPEGFRTRLFLDTRMLVCAPTAYAVHREEGYQYNGSLFTYVLRTPQAGNRNKSMVYMGRSTPGDYAYGSCGGIYSCQVSGIRPMMNIRDDAEVTDEPDQRGIYQF